MNQVTKQNMGDGAPACKAFIETAPHSPHVVTKLYSESQVSGEVPQQNCGRSLSQMRVVVVVDYIIE